MKQSSYHFDIDLVYLWVDGSDPIWLEKRNTTLKKHNRPTEELKGRYEDNDELRYSLRSVEKHAPWIRHIYIVTDNQTPAWLNADHPQITIIDHKDILPPEALPCFNSVIIEYFLYKIPNLSEHFILANDDTFFNRDVTPDFFFKDDGYPIHRMSFKPFSKVEEAFKTLFRKTKSNYQHSIDNASRLVWEKTKRRFIGVTHHNIDAFNKSSLQNIVEVEYKDELNAIIGNQFRSPTDIQRFLVTLHLLATQQGHRKFVNRRESLRLRVHHKNLDKKISKYNPALFCLNDTEHATDSDRKRVKPFLEWLFPNKSTFEI